MKPTKIHCSICGGRSSAEFNYYPAWDQTWCFNCIKRFQVGITSIMGRDFFAFPNPTPYSFFHHMSPNGQWMVDYYNSTAMQYSEPKDGNA